MDAKTMECFIRLYQKKSLRQAAAELYISPQGLSRILQNLEQELNAILFIRTSKGLEPTPAGDYLYIQAKELLRSYRQLTNHLQKLDGRGKDLSLVCGYGVLNAMPYSVILDFRERHPDCAMKWREFPDLQAENLMRNEDYDLGLLVTESSDMWEKYIVTPLFSKKIVLLVYEGHRLYHKEQVSFPELMGEPIIMEGRDFRIFEQFRKKCMEYGFCPDIVAETGDISFCHKLCSMKQGLGISIDFIADFIQTENVRSIPFEGEPFAWKAALVQSKENRLSPAAADFRQYLLDRFCGP